MTSWRCKIISNLQDVDKLRNSIALFNDDFLCPMSQHTLKGNIKYCNFKGNTTQVFQSKCIWNRCLQNISHFEQAAMKWRVINRADSRFAPSQWETLLQSNTVSHWLGTNLESALVNLHFRPPSVLAWLAWGSPEPAWQQYELPLHEPSANCGTPRI